MAGSTPTSVVPHHARAAGDLLVALDTRAEGLAVDEAARRLAADGPNRLPEPPRRSALVCFILQFHSLLIYVLLGAATITVALGHAIDAVVILAVVLVNAVVGFVQEGRAEQALEAIRAMVDPSTTVLRDGSRMTVPAEAIVCGDIVMVEAGDRVTADLRLLRGRNLRVDEAILTGESVPVEKTPAAVALDAVLGDRTCMLYSGTLVAAGQGIGVVVATASATELGRIGGLLGQVQPPKTPLLAQMDRFARTLTTVILGAAALVLAFAVFHREFGFNDAFMAVVGLAVAAIPEGLPAILTITLAMGVRRMAARRAIVRRLPAVETLGAVSVICSDKTGTLTRNEMTARSLATADDTWSVAGTGYAPDGGFERGGQVVDPTADASLGVLIESAVLCNDAALRKVDGAWRVDGDPMEGALVVLGEKAGIAHEDLRRAVPRDDEIPFDAQHRYMATLHHRHDEGSFILIKGAPERVLAMCTHELGATGPRALLADAWQARIDALAADGQRVLAFARQPARVDQQELRFDEVGRGACLLGMVGFIDPPRPEAVAAVAECRAAGIRVIMITGDHAATAQAIGRQLGLDDDPRVMVGHELDALDDAGLHQAVRQTSVFARATPENKLRLVSALQAEGLTVAMTGDGVNDAPALKRADVGVAMGGKGTEAAKQAAEMVLADDNFASIVAAVREGRTVYDNLRKVIGWTLPTNGGEAMTIIAAILLGLALPITPLQILWVNMITAVTLGLTLAFEPTEPGTMRCPPRPRSAPILDGELVWRIVLVSALFCAGAFGVFEWALSRGESIETARTIVVNTLVAMEVFYLFSVRYLHGTALTLRGLLGTRAVLTGVGVVSLSQMAFTWWAPLAGLFDARPMSFVHCTVVVGIGVLLLLAVEIEKPLRRRVLARTRRVPGAA